MASIISHFDSISKMFLIHLSKEDDLVHYYLAKKLEIDIQSLNKSSTSSNDSETDNVKSS